MRVVTTSGTTQIAYTMTAELVVACSTASERSQLEIPAKFAAARCGYVLFVHRIKSPRIDVTARNI